MCTILIVESSRVDSWTAQGALSKALSLREIIFVFCQTIGSATKVINSGLILDGVLTDMTLSDGTGSDIINLVRVSSTEIPIAAMGSTTPGELPDNVPFFRKPVGDPDREILLELWTKSVEISCGY
tara:strand:- start:211 stop:588 length:378 start_codon:yes stop_codon:yes gene_type:complete